MAEQGAGWRREAGIGARYVDARYADTANTAKVPGYTVVDANIAWQALPDVRLGLELNNLFDRQYATSASSDGEQWYLGAPRFVLRHRGLQLLMTPRLRIAGAGLVARRPACRCSRASTWTSAMASCWG